MRIGVYTIARNEAQFVERWAGSARDADHLLVVDTGSTDTTMARLAELAVPHYQISVQPFRFDDARNAALALLPDDLDVAISLDMDEVLTPNWRATLEQNWTGNRLHYGFVCSWTTDGKPGLTMPGRRIVGRHTHRWKHAVHEILMPTVPEIIAVCDDVLMEHHPDPTKSRGQYLDMLKTAVSEDPQDDRNAHYLGREYFFHQCYDDAINEFKRHLELPRANWLPERASSMRYIAKSYQALGDCTLAYQWYIQATLEDKSRDSLIDAAVFLLAQNFFHATIDLCDRALATPSTNEYMAERYARSEGPYDLSAIAHFHLGYKQVAIELATKALQFNPEDRRLQINLEMMQ